jgi:serine/threonine protein kinase
MARTKLLELTRLMVHRFQQYGAVDLAALTAKHGGDEHRATLAKILEMLEVWLALRANNSEQEPQQFATGFGAAEDVRAAFLEAVVSWRMSERDSEAEEDAPGDGPPPPEAPAPDPAQDSDQESVVTGQSLVSVWNWNGCGVGGLGEVADGVDVILHRDVAVKTPRHPSYPRFEKEILLTGSLVHPHIIPVFSLAFNKDGKPAFIMPRVNGGTLLDAINAHHTGKLVGEAKDRSLHWLLQHVVTVARTVQYAHSRTPAVMHRDLKPENILLDADRNLFVADWGHGYRADEPEEPTPGFGTVYYAAPEQWAGTKQGISIDGQRVMSAIRARYPMDIQLAIARELQRGRDLPDACEAVGIRFVELLGHAGYDLAAEFSRPGRLADIYSLGAILYHAVTGQRPFSNSSNAEKLENRYTAPERLVPGVSPELAGIIRKAMATTPGDRYPSAGEFADDLERVMGRLVDEPVKAFKPGEEPLGVRVRRKIRKHAGAIAALLLLFGFTGLAGLSCTAERHIALQHEQQRATTEVQDLRRKSDREVKAEKDRADAAIRTTNEKADGAVNAARVAADEKVAAAKSDADQKVRDQQDKAAKDVEAERARNAESERDELRRRLTRVEFRADLGSKVEKAQEGPRRPLTGADRALVDRFARGVELGVAGSEAERLETRRAPSREISSHAIREEILRRTTPEATKRPARPKLEIADTVVLDYHSRIAWEKPPSGKAAQEFRDRMVRICEHDGAMLDRIRAWTKTPTSRTPTAGLMYEAIDLVVTGRAEGISADAAREATEYRRLATERFLYGYLSGNSFDDAMKSARFEKPGEFVNPDLMKEADAACVREFKRFPEDDKVVAKLRDQPPTADLMIPWSKPGNGPPGDGPGTSVPPGRGPSPMDLLTQEDFAKMAGRLAQHGDGKGVASTEFSLDYRDLLPSQVQDTEKTHFHLLTEEMLKAQKDLPAGLTVQMLRQVGSAQSARERAYDIEKLKGFHRVGAEKGFPQDPWQTWRSRQLHPFSLAEDKR